MFYLGYRDERPVFAAPTSHVLVLGPPRSGKTTRLVVPNARAFPGEVVVTSTKADVIEPLVVSGRTVLLWDPEGDAVEAAGLRRVAWSLVDAAKRYEDAVLGVDAYVEAALGRASGAERHWHDRARALLAPLVRAAATLGGTIDDVVAWVEARDVSEALGELDLQGERRALSGLASVLASEERERSAIFSTAHAALAAYRLGEAPAPERFDPERFVGSGAALVLVAPSASQRILAPIVVALLEQLRRVYYARARRGEPGRLGLVLDELANVAPIPSLGSILSEGVSQGIWLLAAVQDLAQVRERWPALERGLLTLFGTVAVLGGVGDAGTLAVLSTLLGSEDVLEVAVHEGARGRSRTVRRTRQARLEPAALRSLPRGSALIVELAGSSGMVALRGDPPL
ncbi:conserved hypothetical protein [Acidimicrobium ferrooxidans DSM 10331]|uniref:TraD/TraG TraM recognition site domain-containing protein n=1 Tax=Acidimicrobium ferrooxidans (strain DSM 10331 / JCM 15462 / NBRC 103882 / ICP) TaxID=525909 RepID=C7LXV0_ACIFD|nr:TraM recognition domain-containing protein [Acidimicrobium ferrooxidans]ACU53558.1 conserved hypothetical protein [Acidimicrobium ferrooxidans DSM 10331]